MDVVNEMQHMHVTDLAQSNPDYGHQEDRATVITSTTVSIVLGSAAALDNIEAESDGGQIATSFGVSDLRTATGKPLRVPDPPDADNVFAVNAFQCPYCFTFIIVKSSREWQNVSVPPPQVSPWA